MTRYHHKHKDHGTPAPEPSKLQPKGKHKKPEPRYRIERWVTPFWKGRTGYWSRIGKSDTLTEAKHLMQKPSREFGNRTKPVDVRIVDTRTEEVVATARLQPMAPP